MHSCEIRKAIVLLSILGDQVVIFEIN